MKYYVLHRDHEYQVVSVLDGSDPLHGYGSWSLYTGPFDTVEAAEDAIPADYD